MTEFFQSLFGGGNLAMYGEAIFITLKITLISTLFAYLIGVPLGVLLYVTARPASCRTGM